MEFSSKGEAIGHPRVFHLLLSLMSLSHVVTLTDFNPFPRDPVHQPSFETAPVTALSRGQMQPPTLLSLTVVS